MSCLPCTKRPETASETVDLPNLFYLFGLFFFNQCSYSNTMADRLDDRFDSFKAGTAKFPVGTEPQFSLVGSTLT